jgi:hypothetical protein
MLLAARTNLLFLLLLLGKHIESSSSALKPIETSGGLTQDVKLKAACINLFDRVTTCLVESGKTVKCLGLLSVVLRKCFPSAESVNRSHIEMRHLHQFLQLDTGKLQMFALFRDHPSCLCQLFNFDELVGVFSEDHYKAMTLPCFNQIRYSRNFSFFLMEF